MDRSALIASLRKAVDAAPDDVLLRCHLADLLLSDGNSVEAVRHAAAALERQPDSPEAQAVMARAISQPSKADAQPSDAEPAHADVRAPKTAPEQDPPEQDRPDTRPEFDWAQAESELDGVVPRMFVDSDGAPRANANPDAAHPDLDAHNPDAHADADSNPGPDAARAVFDVERSTVRLADVGGMSNVKARLEAAFLAPMRNPELQRLFAKSLRGGLLLYGPPGCGKTFLARAVAGELGAQFVSISLVDVLDMWVGRSERNLHDLFEFARRHRPCVVFLDELDALGQRRTHLRVSATRSTVNQLLQELDGVDTANDGLFVLAATNQPWDIDPAFRRPGRLDRMLLVLPPDEPARDAIVRYHLRERPIAGIDTRRLAKRTDGFSGADLAHLCETAAERALLDSVHTGRPRMIDMSDFEAALAEVRPSVGAWFDSARNVVLFANEGGQYDELAAYLKKRRLL